MSDGAWVTIVVIGGYLLLWAYSKGSDSADRRNEAERQREKAEEADRARREAEQEAYWRPKIRAEQARIARERAATSEQPEA